LASSALADEDIMGLRGGCGFTDDNGWSTGISEGCSAPRSAA